MVPAYLCCVLLSAQALAAGESGGPPPREAGRQQSPALGQASLDRSDFPAPPEAAKCVPAQA